MSDDAVRVLVVDDLEDAAATLALMLELDGYAVRTARDGAQALAVAEVFKPHCILFDIDMPVMNGFELSQQLRQRYRDDIVLIAISAQPLQDPRVAGAFRVADHYFSKPLDPKLLRRLLPPCR